ncbi:hypothetical protein ASPZODRAFT_166988 [Penicilliopsis zonata CBS 506.65]|uniref:N-acetyltransferase domain-containing protein n=1 Tax=Penicilliopsis zonata CBS 506.65 TaxID=1073090 RepID=A0A1L9SHU3_9EURO|nr:hypothetical protein ASPZODRAFT_166988 [Penicilliopsis zonata CBS 506.65]OJJ46790.1 hypothetical protein ASPZODRAFT_166988 [Penicilliopsis zonata CBS 506.65]
MSSIDIRYACEADCTQIAAVNGAAFATGLFLRNAYPQASPAEMIEFRRVHALRQLPDKTTHTLVGVERATGTIVALARWKGAMTRILMNGDYPPAVTLSDQAAALIAKPNSEIALTVCNQGVLDAFAALTKEKHNRYFHEDDIELDLLCTHPLYQGQGIGAAMIKWGTDKADAAKAHIYLQATADAHPLYCRLGWETLDEAVLDYGKYGGEGVNRIYFMRRAPMIYK